MNQGVTIWRIGANEEIGVHWRIPLGIPLGQIYLSKEEYTC